jgi:predicted DCC family thiol-disulfide oxidoreductase YuxK
MPQSTRSLRTRRNDRPHAPEGCTDSGVVLFDGVCNLCVWSVQFVLRRDRDAYFRFAALQSPVGQRLLRRYRVQLPADESVVLIERGHVYTHSEAWLRITRRLGGLWPLLGVVVVLPRPLRDRLYLWIATHRYRWFGRRDACWVASPPRRGRFLG